ncbi:hypothetical protein F3Y22_tig00010263pilonHSYRG00141 [Hibiscus syriacus]|uniref:Uncharacterized protein n=1 Tax=Hibiscus syriacus TaxID=106335 RepID=A0A6A3C5U2_HIBSY|nr:hypothetical protein F3Y22_tig00010263pilonHSYRG00141 [Hibiscus syriacus]
MFVLHCFATTVYDSIVQNAPDVVKAPFDVCFDAIIRIVLESDDHSEMQNATECLASFVSGGRQELLAWGSDSGFTMRSLLDAASRGCAVDIGHLVCFSKMYLKPCSKFQHTKKYSAEGLGGWVLEPELTSEDDVGEIQGAYQIKVTTSALALLLSRITTRSKAKSAPDQWTIMPLPAKILALLADALIEIQEQVHDTEDEGSDWEEIHGDMDSDKDLLSSAAVTPFDNGS